MGVLMTGGMKRQDKKELRPLDLVRSEIRGTTMGVDCGDPWLDWLPSHCQSSAVSLHMILEGAFFLLRDFIFNSTYVGMCS